MIHLALTWPIKTDFIAEDYDKTQWIFLCLVLGTGLSEVVRYTGVYPKVSGLAACSENRKLYSSLPLGAVVSLFCESV
jgi:hypothetical protein